MAYKGCLQSQACKSTTELSGNQSSRGSRPHRTGAWCEFPRELVWGRGRVWCGVLDTDVPKWQQRLELLRRGRWFTSFLFYSTQATSLLFGVSHIQGVFSKSSYKHTQAVLSHPGRHSLIRLTPYLTIIAFMFILTSETNSRSRGSRLEIWWIRWVNYILYCFYHPASFCGLFCFVSHYAPPVLLIVPCK